ncbi:Sterigmatocystin biosynthesis regulatory protein [Smittium culicis]|uniref:Sterigmatocystin biosynthesis regulatory protein n=1 Tax=Smittium culicis TaxID=133412 RepID=A0A1R1XVF7_9FUNG|nr:Sterigmatocystin biosynthesis regulatory protein [Smittium culicis]
MSSSHTRKASLNKYIAAKQHAKDKDLAVLNTCICCQKRKVKCDSLKPSCSNCKRRGELCEYRRSTRYRVTPAKSSIAKPERGSSIGHAQYFYPENSFVDSTIGYMPTSNLIKPRITADSMHLAAQPHFNVPAHSSASPSRGSISSIRTPDSSAYGASPRITHFDPSPAACLHELASEPPSDHTGIFPDRYHTSKNCSMTEHRSYTSQPIVHGHNQFKQLSEPSYTNLHNHITHAPNSGSLPAFSTSYNSPSISHKSTSKISVSFLIN